MFYHLKTMIRKLIVSVLILAATATMSSGAFAEEMSEKEGFLLTIGRFEVAIMKLNPRLSDKQVTRLSTLIAIESKKNRIDPRIILAIINTESSFNQKAISKNKNGTSDISIAQINTAAWKPSLFKERTGYSLDQKRLKHDEAYAISRMCLILSYLKENFAKKDKWWFARYHSATPEFKRVYLVKLSNSFRALRPFGSHLLRDMPDVRFLSKIKEDTPVVVAEIGINKNEKDN